MSQYTSTCSWLIETSLKHLQAISIYEHAPFKIPEVLRPGGLQVSATAVSHMGLLSVLVVSENEEEFEEACISLYI